MLPPMTAILIGLSVVALGLAAIWRHHPPPGHALLVRSASRTKVTQTSTWALPGQAFLVDLSARSLSIVHRRRSALSCRDGVRADITLRVTLSIPGEREAVLRATDVLGPDLQSDDRVAEHFRPRFEEAMRAQLQGRAFAEWSADPGALTAAIVASVGADLDGFRIESAAVVHF
ncbi:MAG: putative membrane protein YqiK, partial [Bradymonadia bacterium]